jgi:hypothetical protein
MEKIRDQIAHTFDSFTGDFVVPKNAYEKKFCDLLRWESFDGRYYDAFNGETFIEIKKGQGGMHFDMVRYAEIVMGFGTQNTVTVFFRWNKNKKCVEEAMVIDTIDLIKFLKIDRHFAKTYLKIYRHVPRGVNILASATAKDLRSIAKFIIKSETPMVKPVPKLKLKLRFPKVQVFYRKLSELDETTDSSKWPVINVFIFS